MDVMKPELVWAAGGCYRFCDSNVWKSSDIEGCLEAVDPHNGKRESAEQGARRKNVAPDQKSERENAVPLEDKRNVIAAPTQMPEKETDCIIPKHGTGAPHIGETKECVAAEKKPSCPEINIERTRSGSFKCIYYVARYFAFLIGFRGGLRCKLERETHTRIKLDDESSQCMITATQKSSIFIAIGRIKTKIAEARAKMDPSHCLSIPLTDETIKTNFAKFKDAVLNEYADDTDVQSNLCFIKPETLHLNLGMLLLVDKNEKNAAFETLAEWKKTIMKPIIEKNGPVRITVEGLDCMTIAESKSYVIYGKVSSENNVLQELAQKTAKLFIQEGLMISKRCLPELYMELLQVPIAVNKKKDCPETTGNIASDIVTAHKDHFFGEIELSAMHLSHCRKYDDNGYYATEAKVGV